MVLRVLKKAIYSKPANFANLAPHKQQHFERLISRISQYIDKINLDIERYNKLPANSDEKIPLLKVIYDQYKELDNQQIDEDIDYLSWYRDIFYNQLVTDITRELQKNGIPSLCPLTTKRQSTPQSEPANLLGQLSSDSINKLINGIRNNHRILPSQFSTEDRQTVDNFLRNYQLRQIGGRNSKNYLIVDKHTGESLQVLKIENRLGMPRNVVAFLEESEAGKHFATTYLATKVTLDEVIRTHYGRRVAKKTYGLVVLDLVKGGDIEQRMQKDKDHKQTLASANNIFQQMTNILQKIEKAQCFFPDMKNINWLVDEKDKVIIADTKSFVFTDENGIYRSGIPNNYQFGFPQTSYMSPPEFDTYKTTPISVTKAHSFQLAKNLYQYLTKCRWTEVANLTEKNVNLNHSIFKTQEGRLYANLIRKSLAIKPTERPTIADINNFFTTFEDRLKLIKQIDALKPKYEKNQSAFRYIQNAERAAHSFVSRTGFLRELTNNLEAHCAKEAGSRIRVRQNPPGPQSPVKKAVSQTRERVKPEAQKPKPPNLEVIGVANIALKEKKLEPPTNIKDFEALKTKGATLETYKKFFSKKDNETIDKVAKIASGAFLAYKDYQTYSKLFDELGTKISTIKSMHTYLTRMYGLLEREKQHMSAPLQRELERNKVKKLLDYESEQELGVVKDTITQINQAYIQETQVWALKTLKENRDILEKEKSRLELFGVTFSLDKFEEIINKVGSCDIIRETIESLNKYRQNILESVQMKENETLADIKTKRIHFLNIKLQPFLKSLLLKVEKISDPEERSLSICSISNALSSMQKIANLRIDDKDEQMSKFINTCFRDFTKIFEKEDTNIALNTFSAKLYNLARKIEQHPGLQEIRKIIAHYRESANISTIGMEKKAQIIEDRYRMMSIDERANFGIKNTNNTLALKQAIATHRGVITRVPEIKGDKIETKNSPRVYRRLEDILDKMRETLEKPHKPN